MDAHGGRYPLPRTALSAKSDASREPLRRILDSNAKAALTYRGLGNDAEATEKMLSRLVTRMRWGGYPWPATGTDAWTSDDNEALPAGYTYLAQLVAHDLVQNTAQLPLISSFPGELQRDYREQRLVLDTIYGGGPGKDPRPYAIAPRGSGDRCLFRLGHVRRDEPQPFEESPQLPLLNQPPRDIPRARCPHLSDQPSIKSTPEAMIADVRNDQHIIISQLTAFFHKLHNIVFGKVRILQNAPSPQLVEQLNLPKIRDYASEDLFKHAQDEMAFLQTRKLVTYVFRRVVVQDLLRRMLEPGVFAYYTDPVRKFPADLYDPMEGNQVPVEFSHAAFRFGHVMSRFSYVLNDTLSPTPSIKSLLDRSSGRRSDLVPLASNWLVDWSHFFDLGDGKPVNASRRIGPFVASGPLTFEAAVPEQPGRDGGLFYRDFLRGYEAGVSTAEALISVLRGPERDRCELLKNANFREHEIGKWLEHDRRVNFTVEELVSISKDPPLLFFILFEAAHTQGGRRLGILGSTLVADVIFSALTLNANVVEGDPAVPILARHVFGDEGPSSMPSLIAFVKAHGGLQPVAFEADA